MEQEENAIDIRVEIGNIIRESRKRCNFTQTDLASRLQVTQQFISAIERGKCDCPDWLIFELKQIILVDYWQIYRLKETLPTWLLPNIAARTVEDNVKKVLFYIVGGRVITFSPLPRKPRYS